MFVESGGWRLRGAERAALARLIAALCDPGGPPLDPSLASALSVSRVQQHRLAPLAYRRGLVRFRDEYIRNALFAELRAPILDQAVAAVSAAGARVILLKGISYVGEIYEDAAERPVGDIDLMVRPRDHDTATRALLGIGYRARSRRQERSRLYHARTLVRDDGANIDLHRSIIQVLRSRIDLEAVWSRAVPAGERADRAERLDPVDEALFHLIHIARHELLVPAIAYVDAPRLMARPGVTWSRVRQRAREYRLERAAAAAMAMVEALASGADEAVWPSRRCALLPSPAEVLAGSPTSRSRQLVRKAVLTQGPRETAGLALVGLAARLGLPRADLDL